MTQAVAPLPLVSVGPSREVRDRLELLHALIQAPTFAPVFRSDIIQVPRDHQVYGWGCHVPECERTAEPDRVLCHNHQREWQAARTAGGTSYPEFLRTAEPLKIRARIDGAFCMICPEIPAWSGYGLCYLHSLRWQAHRRFHRSQGHQDPELLTWVVGQDPFPGFGRCGVAGCPYGAQHPLGLCQRHFQNYSREGRPGGAALPANWGRKTWDGTTNITYTDQKRFQQWLRESAPIHRMDGHVSLLGLRPLAKAEIQWGMFHHTQVPVEGAVWNLLHIRQLAKTCRDQKVNSLADLELDDIPVRAQKVARQMLKYLRLIYFVREDTKDAGFVETEHFGVRFRGSTGHIDLTQITQRWLRDILWDHLVHRLHTSPPRTRGPFDSLRRGCAELSAFLEAQAPTGGHDPAALTDQLMIDFVADQRHRAQHGLAFLRGPVPGAKGKKTTKASKGSVSRHFNDARAVLRRALELGEADRIGLSRGFILALPAGGNFGGRRRPFPDDVARELAKDSNLTRLDEADVEGRGLRDIWEALVVTGRRCSEVLDVRLECIGRLNKLPMFWHDQTKVGNLDDAIRISERLYARLEERQGITVARFFERHGRVPTPQERRELALFPRRTSNREMIKGASYSWFHGAFRDWVDTLDIGHCVPHQARHTLATNLLKNGANLVQVKRYLGQVSDSMAEHYIHLANTDPKLEAALQAVWSIWVAGPGSSEPGLLLTSGEAMAQAEAEAMLVDLTRQSTPAEGGFCTFQPVVNGDACPWNMDCHNCDKFVMSGADLVYWHRKREQWRTMAEGAPDGATADYLHSLFEPTARAIDGLEKALAAVGLLEDALALDLRRPQDYFGRVWATAFRAQELARHEEAGDAA
ncbi:tyrosine-type recombinase/integrase [Streptomyces sp. NPDC002215]|uniref:tyrosine-type recombinase/integrase n=1 Tax=Streptomyces sp. NPDC002215 TaxID=3154412 RepID=UPI00332AC8D0